MHANATEKDHPFFMTAAVAQAKDALGRGEFPVGCVIVDGPRIVARGSRHGSTGPHPNEIDHAEMMALRHLGELDEASDPAGLVLYTTLEPCLMCYGAILLSGISQIVYAYEDVMGGGTGCLLGELPPLYANRHVVLTPGVRRRESLALFQRFFKSPENAYWRGSPLADYTLRQT
jgi:tRNA(adenine34) deaminase